MKKWECTVCGYIHEGEAPPDECPVCGAGPEYFQEVVETVEEPQTDAQPEGQPEAAPEPAAEPAPEPTAEPAPEPAAKPAPEPAAKPAPVSSGEGVKKWECTLCGYIHEGPEPPDSCPVCGAGPEYFKEIVEKEEKTLTEAVLTPQAGDPDKKAAPSLFRKLVMKHHLHPIAVHTPNGVLPLALVFLAIGIVLGQRVRAGRFL